MKNTISILIELRHFYHQKQQRARQTDKVRYQKTLDELDNLIDRETAILIQSLKKNSTT